jgi:HEAT repeat protein
MMTVEDVQERRTAVQCLGMIGNERVLKEVTNIMLTTDDMVVRASCAKAIGAVALKNPDQVPDFPQYALDAMKKAALDIPDPITKLAVMSGLSQIGNNCERALDVILDICKHSDDSPMLTQCMNALGTISASNPEWSDKIAAGIKTVKETKKGIEGYDVLEQMINVQLEKVGGGGASAGFSSLGALGSGTVDPLIAIKEQMNNAFKKGFNNHLQGGA